MSCGPDFFERRLPSDEATLYLSRASERFWFTRIENNSVVYFRYNRIRESSDGTSIDDFATQLAQDLADPSTKRLIINSTSDLTHFGGAR